MKHRFAISITAFAAVLWFSCAHVAHALQAANLLEGGATIDPGSIGMGGADAADSSAYAQGTRAINDGRWSDAVTIFSQVANQAGEHADGALYWKAYALHKLGQSNAALDTCGALRRDHQASKWIEECGALEIEIHASSGQPIQPKAEQSDDLKLLALAALMQQDEKRALAEIDQILNSSDSSERLKHGALLIMGEHHTDTVYPQIARVSLVEGDVRVARGIAKKHDKDASWEKAEADLPLESGYSLVTGSDGRAEIEFEDASTMYLGENSVLVFNDLSTMAGVPNTVIALLSGTTTLHIRPLAGEAFVLHTPTDTLVTKYPGATDLRISSYTDGIAVTPMGQRMMGIAGAKEALTPGQTLYFKDGRRIMLAGPSHSLDFSAWDQWVETRYSEREKELAAVLKDSGLASPVPGLAEMQGQGRFFACEPYGTCWEPTPGSEPKRVAENAVAGSSSGQVPSGAEAQTTTPNATGAKPARQIGFVGKPMPNISPSPNSGSPSADLNAFWPCVPDDVRARYFVPAAAHFQMQPWAWAVCHSGEWLYRNNRYVWVTGRRHHHPPCHWAKSGNRIVLIPTHPRDVKDHPPVNRVNPVVAVNAKGPRPIERVELGSHARIGLMKEPPKEFRAEFVRPLAPVAEPHMMAYRVQDATVAKGGPVRPGTPITFNARMQSFMMTQQEMHGGKSVAVSVPINNHAGDLQGHGGFGGGGSAGRGGFGGGSSGFHGGGGGGSAAHGGGSVSSGGGGSHAAAPSASSGGASSSASSSGGSHH